MNAIEMAAKAMIEKIVGNLPPEVLANIGQIGQTVAGFKAQLDRIENQNRLIIAHLNIPAGADLTRHEPPREYDNAGSGIRNGSGPIGD
jgi:hypothetical protein